jgi:hypothetical protein
MLIWLNVGFIFLYFVRPFDYWPVVDNPALIYGVGLFVFWAFSQFYNPTGFGERLASNILTLGLLLFALAAIVSALLSPYLGFFVNTRFHGWFRVELLFFVILVTSIRTERDLRIIATGFIVVIFILMAQIFWQYLTTGTIPGDGAERMAGVGERFDNVNIVGPLLVLSLPILFPLLTLSKKYWHYLFILGYLLLAIRIITMGGGRANFLMLLSVAILPILFSRYRFKFLLLLPLVLPLGWFALPEDMQIRYRTIVDPTVARGADEYTRQARIRGFTTGLELWKNSPIFGIGPESYRAIRGGTGYMHSLYGQLAGEHGTLGIVTFLFLLSCFGINHYNIWKNYKYLQEKKLEAEGLYCWRMSQAVMYCTVAGLVYGLGEANALFYHWCWFAAFQIRAAQIMQEKITAAMQGKLLPSLPMRK